MRVGYPCINRSLECSSASTFRLRSYSPARLVDTVERNLACLVRILEWNRRHGIRFFRITSDLVPFASHPACRYAWPRRFRPDFEQIGRLIRRNRMRVSMHPDQFILINAPDAQIIASSIRELSYHARVLDLMKLPASAKLQIHVGGVYGDKTAAITRFARNYRLLPLPVRRRLVIENDDRSYTVSDCLEVHRLTRIPVLLDSFHHSLNSSGQPLRAALLLCARTWRRDDGPPMVDYSSQQPGARRGTHAEHIDLRDFRRFLDACRGLNLDVMLEIKDKEQSALRAIDLCRTASRIRRTGDCRRSGD